MNNKYLKLFVDSLEKYQKLNDAEFGRLIRAALAYKANGEEVKLNGREDLLWDSMKLEIDRDNGAYEALCAVRSEAGKKGADVRWQNDGKNSKCHLPYSKESQTCQDKEEDEEKDKEEDNITPLTPHRGEVDVFAEFAGENIALLKTLRAFNEMRDKNKKKMTDHAKTLLLTRLKTYPEKDWIEILNRSILNSWQSIYPLKDDETSGTAKMLNKSYDMMDGWANE